MKKPIITLPTIEPNEDEKLKHFAYCFFLEQGFILYIPSFIYFLIQIILSRFPGHLILMILLAVLYLPLIHFARKKLDFYAEFQTEAFLIFWVANIAACIKYIIG